MNRRDTLKTLLGGGAITALGACSTLSQSAGTAASPDALADSYTRLDKAAGRSVLRTGLLPDPVMIQSIDLLRVGVDDGDDQYFVQVRSTDGLEGICLCNAHRINSVWPIIPTRIAPPVIGTDARNFETTLDRIYLHDSNYKFQGLPFWVGVAWVELAVLDLLGKTSGRTVGELLGTPQRASAGIYYATGDRSSDTDRLIRKLERMVAESGAKAIKYKVGARMKVTDFSMARDLEMIPRARAHFGDDLVIYADSNGSFDVPTSLQMGRLMEEYNYGFFEEPVPFDYLEETKAVADGLDIPIAGGEQESSMWRFRWQIANGALQVVQPDLIYFGGLIRSMKVARMAEAMGLPCVPHISGRGLGSLYMLHFVSALPNTTGYQEWKGDPDPVPYELVNEGGRLASIDGEVKVPTGPGLGIRFDPGYLARASILTEKIAQ